MMTEIKTGDAFTIAGVFKMVPNPDRRWWQLWKPKLVRSDELQVFTVQASRGSARAW